MCRAAFHQRIGAATSPEVCKVGKQPSGRISAVSEPIDAERRNLADVYQRDPSPEGGYCFWRLAMPDIEAAFWATRQQRRALH